MTETILLLIAGAILGVIADRLWRGLGLDESFTRLVERWQAGKNELITEGIQPYLVVGDLKIDDWEIFDGLSPNGIKLVVRIEDIKVRLPEDLAKLRAVIEAELQEMYLTGKPQPFFNGDSFALKSFYFTRSSDRRETNTCQIVLRPSEFYNFLATIYGLDRHLPNESQTVKEKYFSNVNPRSITEPSLFQSFGVNLAVITSDMRLILIKRSNTVVAGRLVYDTAVDEGLNPKDLDENGNLDYMETAYRGLAEELGVTRGEVDECMLTSLGYSHGLCQHGVLGHARLNITFDELKRKFSLSKDGAFEIAVKQEGGEYDIQGIQFKPEALAEFIVKRLNEDNPIVSFALCCSLLAFPSTRLYDRKHLDRHFVGDVFKKAAFVTPRNTKGHN